MEPTPIDQIRQLIARGDARAGSGDDRGATSFYSAALKRASALPHVPEGLMPALRHAEGQCRHYAQIYESYLMDALDKATPPRRGTRFAAAMDILLGRRQIYLQKPRSFYFPQLPAQEFYLREAFDWVAPLEGHTAAIREEARALLEDPAAFAPYLEGDTTRAQEDHAMTGSGDWSAFYLWKDGCKIEENAARCPATMAALEKVPVSAVPGRLPTVLFSLLRPGAHIPPHHGLINTRLICHLPLIVPEGCALRVGSTIRAWREGETLIFDDTIEHEARNDSREPRVVLLFDVWQPGLSGEERDQVATLLAAITDYDRQRENA